MTVSNHRLRGFKHWLQLRRDFSATPITRLFITGLFIGDQERRAEGRQRGWGSWGGAATQWLKWSCEAGGGAHVTKSGWSKPIPHPTSPIWRYLGI